MSKESLVIPCLHVRQQLRSGKSGQNYEQRSIRSRKQGSRPEPLASRSRASSCSCKDKAMDNHQIKVTIQEPEVIRAVRRPGSGLESGASQGQGMKGSGANKSGAKGSGLECETRSQQTETRKLRTNNHGLKTVRGPRTRWGIICSIE